MENLSKRIIGFSSADTNASSTNYTYIDYDIAKRDLMNHFYTRKGERVMLPEFGSIIWDMVMEPMTAANKDLILYDATRIVQSDTRFRMVSVDVTEYENGLQIDLILQYVPARTVVEFSLEFDRRLAQR